LARNCLWDVCVARLKITNQLKYWKLILCFFPIFFHTHMCNVDMKCVKENINTIFNCYYYIDERSSLVECGFLCVGKWFFQSLLLLSHDSYVRVMKTFQSTHKRDNRMNIHTNIYHFYFADWIDKCEDINFMLSTKCVCKWNLFHYLMIIDYFEWLTQVREQFSSDKNL
jgi:hypothetical protein